MIVRELDENSDWTYGKGKNNYLKDKKALGQTLGTRLKSFLGDCFFALQDGIDWYNLLSTPGSELQLRLSISATILNTVGVTGLQEIGFSIDERTRAATITYRVATIYGLISNQFIFDSNPIG